MNPKKTELRRQIRLEKTRYSASTLKTLSESIIKRLESDEQFQASRCILLYYSMDDEVCTHNFIEKWSHTKTILLPVVVGDSLELRVFSGTDCMIIGKYGIKEPSGAVFTNYDEIDLAVIPGMAFDKRGNRLGRGKGYYDKLLPEIKAMKIGICFPFQLVDNVPTEQFDIIMDKVVYDPY